MTDGVSQMTNHPGFIDKLFVANDTVEPLFPAVFDDQKYVRICCQRKLVAGSKRHPLLGLFLGFEICNISLNVRLYAVPPIGRVFLREDVQNELTQVILKYEKKLVHQR